MEDELFQNPMQPILLTLDCAGAFVVR